MFDYMGAFLFRSGFAHADNVITKRCSKTITWLFLSRLQGNKPLLNLPKPWNSPPAQTGTLRNLRNLPPEPTPAHIGILWNLREPASGTYTTTHRDFPEPSGTCLRNLHQHTPEPSGTFRNLPPEPTPAHAGTLRKLHQHSGTFRNLPPELTRAHTGTLRNLPEPSSGTCTSTHRNPPEPSSGTCSCDPHRHTPELIWAEDPISLRCWGKKNKWNTQKKQENHKKNNPMPQALWSSRSSWFSFFVFLFFLFIFWLLRPLCFPLLFIYALCPRHKWATWSLCNILKA